jgi:peptidoglycan/LPS O-acetylase OafA/YrhL
VSALTLACAFMSWCLVEEPALRLKRLGRLRQPALAAETN